MYLFMKYNIPFSISLASYKKNIYPSGNILTNRNKQQFLVGFLTDHHLLVSCIPECRCKFKKQIDHHVLLVKSHEIPLNPCNANYFVD